MAFKQQQYATVVEIELLKKKIVVLQKKNDFSLSGMNIIHEMKVLRASLSHNVILGVFI